MSKFATLSLTEAAKVFNDMVGRYNANLTSRLQPLTQEGKKLATFNQVKKFSDKATALKRLGELATALDAWEANVGNQPPAAAEVVRQPATTQEQKAPVVNEDTMAKKTAKAKTAPVPKADPAPKAPKAAPAPKAPKADPNWAGDNALLNTTREGTYRASLIRALQANAGRQVPVGDLVGAVYGDKGTDSALKMVLVGLTKAIKKGGLPYRVQVKKGSVGLYDADASDQAEEEAPETQETNQDDQAEEEAPETQAEDETQQATTAEEQNAAA